MSSVGCTFLFARSANVSINKVEGISFSCIIDSVASWYSSFNQVKCQSSIGIPTTFCDTRKTVICETSKTIFWETRRIVFSKTGKLCFAKRANLCFETEEKFSCSLEDEQNNVF